MGLGGSAIVMPTFGLLWLWSNICCWFGVGDGVLLLEALSAVVGLPQANCCYCYVAIRLIPKRRAWELVVTAPCVRLY